MPKSRPSVFDPKYDGMKSYAELTRALDNDQALWDMAYGNNQNNTNIIYTNSGKSIGDYYLDVDELLLEDDEEELDEIDNLKYEYADMRYKYDTLRARATELKGISQIAVALLIFIPFAIIVALDESVRDLGVKSIIGILLASFTIQIIREICEHLTLSNLEITKKKMKSLKKIIKEKE